MRRSRYAVVAGLTVAALAAGCGSSAPDARHCLPVPSSFPERTLLDSETTRLNVHPGATVFVSLVEDEQQTNFGGGAFPWATPVSSSRAVLAPVPLCPSTGASSLPVQATAFRAVSPGRATVTAALAAAWRGGPDGTRAYRATVVVQR